MVLSRQRTRTQKRVPKRGPKFVPRHFTLRGGEMTRRLTRTELQDYIVRIHDIINNREVEPHQMDEMHRILRRIENRLDDMELDQGASPLAAQAPTYLDQRPDDDDDDGVDPDPNMPKNCKDYVMVNRNGREVASCPVCKVGYAPVVQDGIQVCKVAHLSTVELRDDDKLPHSVTARTPDGDLTREGWNPDKDYDCETCDWGYIPIGPKGNRRCVPIRTPIDPNNRVGCKATVGDDCTICKFGQVPAGPNFHRRCILAGQFWNGQTGRYEDNIRNDPYPEVPRRRPAPVPVRASPPPPQPPLPSSRYMPEPSSPPQPQQPAALPEAEAVREAPAVALAMPVAEAQADAEEILPEPRPEPSRYPTPEEPVDEIPPPTEPRRRLRSRPHTKGTVAEPRLATGGASSRKHRKHRNRRRTRKHPSH